MKNLSRLFSAFVLMLILNINSNAQNIGDYTFSNVIGNYTPLSGDSIVVATNASNDDGITAAIDIGFNFNFGTRTFSQIKMNTNDWLTFNSASTSTTQYSVLSSTETNVVATFARDMNGTATSMSILRDNSGGAGNRILKVQWKNQFSFSSTTVPAVANVQIWLMENGNKVEIHYGSYDPGTRTSAATVQVGLKSGSTATDSIKSVSGTTWPGAVGSSSSAATIAISTTDLPDSNRVFKFEPGVMLANDVGTIAITNPLNGGAAGNQAPQAVIKNYGTNNQFTAFNITCTINPGGYTSTVSDTLSAGASRVETFANFVFTQGVPYTVTVYTSLASDMNHLNDTQRVVVRLIDLNFGSDSSYFYANSLATSQPTFPRYGWKDTTGSKSLIVNGVQTAGTTLIGNKDDGYFVLSLRDILVALNQDTTNKHIKFNGNCYDSIFPGTNGIIGMTQQYGATSISIVSIDGAKVAKNALLPLWHDANLGVLGSATTNRLSYKIKGNQLIITYDHATSYAPTTDFVSYQVVAEIVTGCGSANSNFRYTYADTTNGQTSASFINNYLIGYDTTQGAVTTFRNFVVGFSGNGSPNPYGAYVSPVNPFLASPSTPLYVIRPIFNPANGKGLAVEYGPNNNNLNSMDVLFLKLSLSLQGLQSNFRVRDTVEIALRDASVAPYKVFQKQNVYLDSANNGTYSYGTKTIELSLLKRDYPYYLVINHRNSVLSWSNIAMTSGDTLIYDFTTAVSKTFGSNAILVHGAASFYSGDVDSTHDGCVNLTDVILVKNGVTSFVTGSYVLTDLNWDGSVNLPDLVIAANNNTSFICKKQPVGAVSPMGDELSNEQVYNYDQTKLGTQTINIPDAYSLTKEQWLFKNNSDKK
ncbi:MAG: hypothetical protein ABI462_03005 [Ignavibacteria bacterium]